MVKLYLILAFFTLVSTLGAQTVLTEAYLPVAGDTLRYSRAGELPTIDQLGPGVDREWDFGFIPSDEDFELVYSAVPATAPFPNADLVLESGDSTAAYYSLSDGTLSLVGIVGELQLFQGRDLTAPVNPPLPDRRAPLRYGDRFDNSSSVQVVIARDSLPAAAQEQFGTILSGVDSIRVTSTTEREDVVDAYGTLRINGRTYTVLREARTEIMDNQIEVRVGVLGYTNVTGLVSPLAPQFADFLGRQPARTTYFYWSDEVKESVATVAVDEMGDLTDVAFIKGDATNSIGGPYLQQTLVRLYPNPASHLANFELDGLDPGTYTLRVTNVLGRQVAAQQFSATGGEARLDLDVSKLPRGTYLYSVTNERGRTLTTQRLLVGG